MLTVVQSEQVLLANASKISMETHTLDVALNVSSTVTVLGTWLASILSVKIHVLAFALETLFVLYQTRYQFARVHLVRLVMLSVHVFITKNDDHKSKQIHVHRHLAVAMPIVAYLGQVLFVNVLQAILEIHM